MKKLINFFKIKKLLLNSNGENSYNFFYVEEPNDKKNTFNRVQYISDKIWTIQRGIWVEYFRNYPKDLPKVLKKTQSQGYSLPTLWVKSKDNHTKYVIVRVTEDEVTICLESYVYTIGLNQLFSRYTWLDDSPCGINEQKMKFDV